MNSYQPDHNTSYSESLPLGLGSSNILVGMWPDIALIGGGALARRFGIQMATGDAMFSRRSGYFDHKLGKAGGFFGRNVSAMEDILYGRASKIASRAGHNLHIPQRISKGLEWQLGIHSGEVGFRGEGGKIWRASEKVFNKVVAERSARVGILRASANRGAKFYRAGQIMKGTGIGLIAASIFATGLDIGEAAGNAVLDYQPRKKTSGTEFGALYYDPRGAYTQRQRAIAAIHDSQLTTRAAIGGEASFMHR